MATPTIAEAFARAIRKGRNLGPDGQPVTIERVTRVLGGDQVEVRGAIVPVTGLGLRALRAGSPVAVGWQKGRPVVAIAHSAKRSGVPVPLPVLGEQLVEELFIAQRPEDDVRDVYVRTFEGVSALRLDRFLDTAGFSTLRWGPTNEWFFVQEGSKHHIFHFDRTPDEPVAASDDLVDLVTLDRTEDLSTKTMTLLTLDAPDAAPIVVAANAANVTQVSRSLAVDGSLIVSYEVRAAATSVPDNKPAANFASSLASAFTINGFTGTMAWPVVADVTNGVVLLSGFEDLELLAPMIESLFDYNNTPRVEFPFFGSVLVGFARPTTWVPGNSFAFALDPPFEGHTELVTTWQFGYSETPSSVRAVLDPILVLGASVAAGERVRGFVAWARLEYNIFLGQIFNIPSWIFFIDPINSDQFPVAPAPPFPVTQQTGAVAQAPTDGGMRVLYPVSRPAGGLSFASTWHHVVWRKPAGLTFSPDLGAGGEAPGFITAFVDGSEVQITAELRARFGDRGLQVLPPDFVYQPDAPPDPLPADAAVNYFIDLWPFAEGVGAVPVNVADGGGFPEDAELGELEPFKELADLPEGVVQPSSQGLRWFYVNNFEDTLTQAGLFEDRPGSELEEVV